MNLTENLTGRILRIVLVAGGVCALPPLAGAQTLPPETAARAKVFKEADNVYMRALCNGSKDERDAALALRSRAEADLDQKIGDAVMLTPEVLKARGAVARAADLADTIADDVKISASEKADAQDKVQSAKADFRATIAVQRSRIEAQISLDYKVYFDAANSCADLAKTDQTNTDLKNDQAKTDQGRTDQGKPDQSKSDQTKPDQNKADQNKADQNKADQRKAAQQKNPPAKPVRRARQDTGGEDRGGGTYAPVAPLGGGGLSIGGVGIGIGGGGITIGR